MNKKLTYALHGTQNAYLITRKPVIIAGDLTLEFKGLDEAEITVKISNSKHYFEIKQGKCKIPICLLQNNKGIISFSVYAYNGTTKYEAWKCEAIEYEKTADGRFLVYHAPLEFEEAAANLFLAFEENNKKLKELEKKTIKLAEKLESYIGFKTE